MSIICLANSNKPGGRCIIGKDFQKNWIRPVSQDGNGHLNNVSHINVLDRLEIPGLKKHWNYDYPYQTEDYYFNGTVFSWGRQSPEYFKWDNGSLLFKYADDNALYNLDDFTDYPYSLFGITEDKDNNDKIHYTKANNRNQSAYLIKSNNSSCSFEYDKHNNLRGRISFNYRGITHRLKITDPYFFQQFKDDKLIKYNAFNFKEDTYLKILDPHYICVVLGQQFGLFSYLLATSVIVKNI